MYFGNVSGMTAFAPSRLSTNPVAPPIVLSALRVSGREVRPEPGGILEQPIEDTESITLAYAQNEFSVDFVGLHFINPTRNRYSWRLEGYDDDWSEPGFLRTATYTNLPPGEYTLTVRAANPDGVWNEEGTSLTVTILPPWWRTGWAYLLFALLLAATVFGVDRLQRVRLLRQERERAAIQAAMECGVAGSIDYVRIGRAAGDQRHAIRQLASVPLGTHGSHNDQQGCKPESYTTVDRNKELLTPHPTLSGLPKSPHLTKEST